MAADKPDPVVLTEDIRSLGDPFDIKMRAPGLVKFFMQGLAEIKKQMEDAAKAAEKPLPQPQEQTPSLPVVAPPAPPLPSVPVPPRRKVDMPELNVSGIVYDTTVPQAIVNGKVVREGESVDGVRIVKIRRGLISARFEDQDVLIKFNNE